MPVHDGEAYLENCDNYMAWEELMIAENLKDYENVTLSYEAFIVRLKRLFGLSDKSANLVGLSKLYDTLICDKYLGKALPEGLSSLDLENLRHLHDYLYLMIHSGTYTRIISTPLFTKILETFDGAVAQKSGKLTVFSGHDTNISPTLSFLELSSYQCIEDAWQGEPLDKYLNCEVGPAFAANVIVELWAQEPGHTGAYVKVKYNGKEANICGRRQKTCEYTEWRKWVASKFVDYERLCALPRARID